MSKAKVRKVVLAYSGGLDTSVIVPWLRETYDCEVICFTADIGQGEELGGLEAKARGSGASRLVIRDLREEFAREYLFRVLRAGAVYERKYLLGTSIARPLIAKHQVDLAHEVGADALAHGATGKGNDQVRFELTYMALDPRLRVISPWREWDIRSRQDAIAYARARKIPITASEQSIFSRDRNLWHLSHEGGPLEDPWVEPTESMYQISTSPESAPDEAVDLEIGFESGTPATLDGERLSPAEMIGHLNALGGTHGVGRVDMVESRLVGMKSHGVYETPGGTILHAAHRELESIVLDRDTLRLKDVLALTYADLVYNGQWFSPLRAPDGWRVELERIDPAAQVESNGFASPAHLGEKNSVLTRAFLRSIRDEGGQPAFVLKSGTADLNLVGPAWGCPALAYGPGDSSLDHTPNEHIMVGEYGRAVAVLRGALEGLSRLPGHL